MPPFFSIIVPVYNRAALIGRTLQSLLRQRFEAFEIIVVNDGSTDNTAEVIGAMAGDKIKAFNKENGERAAARNFGARQAAGQYLIFFDSDDLMYEDHLQTAHDCLLANGLPPVAYSGFEYVNGQGHVFKKVLVNARNFKQKLVMDNFLGCNSVVIKKEVFQQFWFNENRLLTTAEDRELWLRIASVHRFHFIPKITFAMLEHSNRSLNQLTAQRVEEIKCTLVDALKASPVFLSSFRRHAAFLFAYEYSLVSSYWSAAGDVKKGKKFLRMAFRHSPAVIFSKRFQAALKNYITGTFGRGKAHVA